MFWLKIWVLSKVMSVLMLEIITRNFSRHFLQFNGECTFCMGLFICHFFIHLIINFFNEMEVPIIHMENTLPLRVHPCLWQLYEALLQKGWNSVFLAWSSELWKFLWGCTWVFQSALFISVWLHFTCNNLLFAISLALWVWLKRGYSSAF